MKLLLDQNISFRVVKKLTDHFPVVEGVRDHGLYEADDRSIWEYCRKNGYTVVTFDEDLYNLTTLYGPPPQIIWIKTGNLTNDQVAELLIRFKANIIQFTRTDNLLANGCLAVYMSGTAQL
jgi:predicted nuclease of predicted toxin-antitoxin system